VWIAATPSGRIFFFLAGKSLERAVGGSVCLPEAGGGRRQVAAAGLIWLDDKMIGCFDFIFSVCIYLNKIRCQFFIGGKKVGLFAMTE
jgi:hypothetical protein